MRPRNTRIISEVTVHAVERRKAELRYFEKRPLFHQPTDWEGEWENSDAWRLGNHKPHGFTVAVIAYNVDPQAHLGLHRRDATKILQKSGLRAPTHYETLCLASEEIWLQNLKDVMRKNEGRNIASLVSINPEHPFYYYFGYYGVKGTEEFKICLYRKIQERDDLYFGCHTSNGRLRERKEAFPLLLGVKIGSENTFLPPAKKAVALGKRIHEDIKCHAYPQHKGAICLEMGGGHAMMMQCVECNYIFEIDGE